MSKARILIVEDEVIIAMETKHTLVKLGYEVVSIVGSGEEAVKRSGEENPDLILKHLHRACH